MEMRVLLITHNLILKNISGCGIRCPCKRCKNKRFLDADVIMIHLLYIKKFMEKYLCWFAHKKQYVPYKAMIERIVKSTSSSNNMHGVIDDNSNRYRSMLMDVMRINQSDIGE
jgi:hypothetical protein